MESLRACVGAILAAALYGQPVVINPEVTRLAFQPSFDARPGAPATYIWNSYLLSHEKIFAVSINGDRVGQPLQLSPGAGVYYQPVFVATGANQGWAVWVRLTDGSRRVVGRRLRAGRWDPQVTLATDALAPAMVSERNRVLLAWEDHSVNPQRIRVRAWNGERWGEATFVSPPSSPSYRPAPAVIAGEPWVFWDSYDGQEYAVWGRRRGGEPVRLSATGRDSLKATAANGVVAWVSTVDVRGGGALDHWDTIEAAVYRDGQWDSPEKVADLRHGLLADILPKPKAMWGYAGRRRQPMLAADGDGAWLVWERKTIHDGRSYTTGEICGRRYSGGVWAEPVLLHRGMVDYHLATNAAVRDGRLRVVGKDIHHYYSSFEVELAAGTPLPGREWPGWEKTRLRPPGGERPSIEAAGHTYHLYWGDLHVHSELSPDAEGEVDELMHFARDRAGLDVVVIQENDSNSWMNHSPQGAFRNHLLAESEYRLSVYLSRRYTEPGRFVALPGWEWSQRTDDNKPNHRTVIFAGDETPLVRHPENGNDFSELCDVVEAAGGLLHTQHEVYRLVDRPCDANIEVAAGWGVYIRDPSKIHADLSAGYKVGFVATSDGHRRNPGTGGGLTAIYAEELTPESVLEALRAHRVYATNGARPMLDARANGVLQGQDVTSGPTVRLTLAVAAPRPVLRAELIRDGRTIHVLDGDRRLVFDGQYLDEPGQGFHWYYWRIVMEGVSPDYPANLKAAEGNLAWTSPHQVTVRE